MADEIGKTEGYGLPLRDDKKEQKRKKKISQKQEKLRRQRIKDQRKLQKMSGGETPDTPDKTVETVKGIGKPKIMPEKPEEEFNFVPISMKENFTSEVDGGSFDEKGEWTSPKHEVINKIDEDVKAGNISVNEASEKMDAAMQLDDELEVDRQGAEAVVKVFNGEELPEGQTNKSGTPVQTINDIGGGLQEYVEGIERDEPWAYEGLSNFAKSIGNTPIEYGEPALERLGLQDYYPDINMPLQVGTYSGQIVGNNPIFVAEEVIFQLV